MDCLVTTACNTSYRNWAYLVTNDWNASWENGARLVETHFDPSIFMRNRSLNREVSKMACSIYTHYRTCDKWETPRVRGITEALDDGGYMFMFICYIYYT